MNDDTKDADDKFPFLHDCDDNTPNATINYTWSTGYGYYISPTLESIDGKIENIKVLIKNLEGRISVIEQNMLRLITKVEEILDKVKKDGKV